MTNRTKNRATRTIYSQSAQKQINSFSGLKYTTHPLIQCTKC